MEWDNIIGSFASVASILCQLVGIEICFHIVRKGGTDLMSPVPFVTFFVGGCCWIQYGVLLNDFYLALTNAIGVVLQLIYIVIFYIYTTKKSNFRQTLVLGLIVLFLPLLYVNYWQPDVAVAIQHLGFFCCCMCVCCFASPFASLKAVCQSKSTESMSFLLCFFNFISAGSWFSYGILLKDSFIILPNIIGICLGVSQLVLFCIYPKPRAHQITVTPTLLT